MRLSPKIQIMNSVTERLQETPLKKTWIAPPEQEVDEKPQSSPVFTGPKQRLIRVMIWINILFVAIRTYKNPLRAIGETKRLLRLRNQFRSGHHLKKFAHIDRYVLRERCSKRARRRNEFFCTDDRSRASQTA